MRIHKKLMTQKEWHVAMASPLEMAKPSIGTPVELEAVHLVGRFILDEWTWAAWPVAWLGPINDSNLKVFAGLNGRPALTCFCLFGF